jgi:DNA-binding HxlR family transcriptional regulator
MGRKVAMRFSENLCRRYQGAVEIIAKRWTPLILRVLVGKPLRFSELAEQLEVVSDRVLSERLKELEQEGIVERRVLAEPPIRVEYSLTEKGKALAPVIEAIEAWSHRWLELDPALPVTSAGAHSALDTPEEAKMDR